MEYDLIVIGGGAGGLGAARTAAWRGGRILLVHEGPIGGDCTFTGCVPSKALIAAAARGDSFADAFGVARRAVDTVAAAENADTLGAQGIDVLEGRATFLSSSSVSVEGRTITARHLVVATGARPAIPAIEGLDGVDVLTNESVFDLRSQPASLAILGGGAIGCELAQAFARLGTPVTVLEALDRVLPLEDPAASDVVHDALVADGIDVRVGQLVAKANAAGTQGGVRLHTEAGDPIEAERLLVATGRAPVTDGLDLEAAGVEVDDRGFIRTNDDMRTTARGVYAVGDVVGRLHLTHAANEMGMIAATNALRRGRRQRFVAGRVPRVTFTDPEVAHVGLTEAEAAGRGGRVAEIPVDAIDRAIVSGETRGFVRLVAGPRPVLRNAFGGRLLGATIVAARAGDVIGEAALAMRTGMFVGRLAQTVHPYPTWSLAVQQAAALFFAEIDGRTARPARAT